MSDITLDHVTPRSLGGSDTVENLQLAHHACNQAKGAMTAEDWAALQEA